MGWLYNLLGNTTFLTVTAGTLVFVLGQFFLEFVLKPIRRYRELKAETAFCLRFYRAKFSNCIVDEAAQGAAKELAAKFIAYSQEKPFWLRVKKADLRECCEKLTLLYHCVKQGKEDIEVAYNCEKRIVEILDLYGF